MPLETGESNTRETVRTKELSVNPAICWEAWRIPRYPLEGHMASKVGDNAMGAGNQQGRPDVLCHYVAGFVDGEGSFHVSGAEKPNCALEVAGDSRVPRLPE